jgi:hypothetical protein
MEKGGIGIDDAASQNSSASERLEKIHARELAKTV